MADGDEVVIEAPSEDYMVRHSLKFQNLENSEARIAAHKPKNCDGGPCPLHNRTDHPMRSWPQIWRGDRGFMERLCSHGIGHPDPDCRAADPVHGCDGCCVALECRDDSPRVQASKIKSFWKSFLFGVRTF